MYKAKGDSYLKQAHTASLKMQEFEARILAEAKSKGVEAVFIDDEITLKGRRAEEVLQAAKKVFDV